MDTVPVPERIILTTVSVAPGSLASSQGATATVKMDVTAVEVDQPRPEDGEYTT